MRKRHDSKAVTPVIGGIVAVALLVLATACAGPLRAPGDAGGECSVAPVLGQVAGLGAGERTARLRELAQQEGASSQLYSPTANDQITGLLDGFSERYGITVEPYSATSEEVLQRLGSEERAGRTQADLIESNGTDLIVASGEGLLAPVTTPYAEPLPPEVVFPDWIGTRSNVFTVLRNPSIVADADAPRTYLELADPKYDGQIGIDAGNWDLVATIVGHLQKVEGLSEEEAIGVWKEITHGARVYTGNTPLAEAVNQGELGLAITYNHYYTRFADNGSIAWEPAIEPQVLRPQGVAIPCHAPHPATALLLFDFVVSEDGQRLLGEIGNRDVTNPNVELGLLRGTDHERLFVDLESVVADSDKWVSIYDEMVRNASQ
jgi:iron(III) transport system substrate-binding protein